MSIIRDVRERVLTKLHELQLQAPGNEMLGISLANLSLAISNLSTVAMVTRIECYALESRVWWASFGEDMTLLRAEYAQRRGLDRDTHPCPETVRQVALEWLTGIDYGLAIYVSDN